MNKDVRERILKASQACADTGHGPDTVLVPREHAIMFNCHADMHVYVGVDPSTRCKCGANLLGAKGYRE